MPNADGQCGGHPCRTMSWLLRQAAPGAEQRLPVHDPIVQDKRAWDINVKFRGTGTAKNCHRRHPTLHETTGGRSIQRRVTTGLKSLSDSHYNPRLGLMGSPTTQFAEAGPLLAGLRKTVLSVREKHCNMHHPTTKATSQGHATAKTYCT